MDREQKDRVKKYLEAMFKAMERKEHDFECPLCGGKAHWTRSDYNGHLGTKCETCGFFIME